jgi:DNA modification methylase
MVPSEHVFSTATVAQKAHIHKDTLLRWLRQGLVNEPSRNRYGWRVWTEDEARLVVDLARASQHPETPASAEEPQLVRLRQIDWDFKDAKTGYLTHGIHPYPAKYIPQIPNALIQEFSRVKENVGDIFCGSGTTLVEGLLLRRNVVGLDANPLAALISKAKTTALTDGDSSLLLELADKALQLGRQITIDEQPTLFSAPLFVSREPRPVEKAISFWFEPFVVEELAELRAWCLALPTEAARNLALVSFAAIIVPVSLQDSDTRYVRRNKDIKPGDTMRRFGQILTDNTKAAEKLTDILDPDLSCQVVTGNVLQNPDLPILDLVVCSPPYPNAYSYHLYHMTRMLWLEMDQAGFKKDEIGSHRKFSNPGKNGATIETFQEEMSTMFSWLRNVIRAKRYACFIVGDSTIRGHVFDNAEVLRDAGHHTGWVQVAKWERNMKDTSKAFNPKIGKIKTERIVIFQNQGRQV